jgi:hypothetical protein
VREIQALPPSTLKDYIDLRTISERKFPQLKTTSEEEFCVKENIVLQVVEEWKHTESRGSNSVDSSWKRETKEYLVNKDSKGTLFIQDDDKENSQKVKVAPEFISDNLFQVLSSNFEHVNDGNSNDLNLSMGVNFALKNRDFGIGIQMDNSRTPRTLGFKKIERAIMKDSPVFASGVMKKHSDGFYYLEPQDPKLPVTRQKFCISLGNESDYFQNETRSANTYFKLGVLGVGMGILTAAGTVMIHMLLRNDD